MEPTRRQPLETTIEIFFTVAFLGLIAERLLALFTANEGLIVGSSNSLLAFFLENILPIIKIIAIIIAVLSIVGISYCVNRLSKINRALNALYNPSLGAPTSINSEEQKNRRWERVLGHLESENPNDWKFAIIEADIILNELLDAMGYRGETMSDKLKNIEISDFQTLNDAWEAHKVRNVIAHEGSDYVISKTEANRIISLYEKVFKEFQFI